MPRRPASIFDPENMLPEDAVGIFDQPLERSPTVGGGPSDLQPGQPMGGMFNPPGVMEETPVAPKAKDGIRLPTQPGPANRGAEEDKGSIWDSAENLREQQQAERDALKAELEARRAQAIQQGEARAGAAGMGLSGATGAQIADIGRIQGREADLAMAQLGRRQRDEGWQQMQRSFALWDFEESDNKDYDGDGFIGKPPGADLSEQTKVPEGGSADFNKDGVVDAREAKIASDTESAYMDSRWREAEGLPERDSAGNAQKVRTAKNPSTGEVWDVYRGSDGKLFKVKRQ